MTQGIRLKMTPGLRLRSAVCETEIIVVRPPKEETAIYCGGSPMVGADAPIDTRAGPHPDFATGTILGKRYADEAATLEVLCVKPGAGTLALGTTMLQPKGARSLPATD